jgi:hypothetical protein
MSFTRVKRKGAWCRTPEDIFSALYSAPRSARFTLVIVMVLIVQLRYSSTLPSTSVLKIAVGVQQNARITKHINKVRVCRT